MLLRWICALLLSVNYLHLSRYECADSTRVSLNTALLLLAAICAFAANSILCRLALASGHIDAFTFTSVRLLSGAVILTFILIAKSRRPIIAIDPLATLALVVYALAFSISYIGLEAGVGAMLIAGFAWGIYSLRGAHVDDPVAATASNFLAAAPMTVALAFIVSDGWHITSEGIVLAAMSGAVTSGLGYVLWYHVVKRIPVFTAATLQLAVPIFAALGGVVILGEPLTTRLAFASITVLGGIALVVQGRQSSVASASGGTSRSTRPSKEQWIYGAGI